MRLWPLFFVVLLLSCRAPKPPATKAPVPNLFFRQVRVFDGEKLLRADVRVEGGRVVAMGQLEPDARSEIVEGGTRTLMPLMIDAHVHAGEEDAHYVQNLKFGVGLIVDMFGPPEKLAARHAAEGKFDTLTDLYGAGILATATGGHGTEFGVPIPTIDAPEAAQAFVDARLREGSDFLKIVLEHDMPTLSRETFRALVVAAHARHKKVMVHVGTEDEARLALEEGADGLAHLYSDGASPEVASLAKSRHAFVIPTLTVVLRHCNVRPGYEIADDPKLSPLLDEKALKFLRKSWKGEDKPCAANAFAAVRAMHAAGVPILAGTDAGNAGTAHGASLHGELSLLVQAGLTPTEALAAATSVPARVLGLDGRGRIAPGARADFMLVDGDPSQDVKATRAIVTIWKLGVRVPRS